MRRAAPGDPLRGRAAAVLLLAVAGRAIYAAGLEFHPRRLGLTGDRGGFFVPYRRFTISLILTNQRYLL